MKIRVCASSDPLHHASYLQGVFDVGGRGNVRFSLRGFPEFGKRGLMDQGDDLAFIVEGADWKVFIDQHDRTSLNATALAWCDAYGKVNLSTDPVPPEHAEKVLPIGPHFPFRVFNAIQTGWHAGWTYLLARRRVSHPKRHFAHWRALWKRRLPEAAYSPGASEANYVFFSASLWTREDAPSESEPCNFERARFIDVCRDLDGVEFEGGFDQGRKVKGFENLMAERRPAHAEYVAKTRRSAVVFNAPARLGCHGWKLGEFLALGKAIITTPPLRALPAPLEHGKHVHLVDGSKEAIREAVIQICRNDDYRRQLEYGAREYYDLVIHPRRVIERMLGRFSEEQRVGAGRVTQAA